MGLTEALIFGLVALTFAIFAIVLLAVKKSVLSSIAGIITVGFVCLSAYNWWLALGDSGKNQQWLGFDEYPLVVIILLALTGTGLFCIIKTIIHLLMKKNKGR